MAGLALLAAALVDVLPRGGRRPRPAPDGSRARRAWIAMDIAVASWVAAGIVSALAGGALRLGLFGEIEQREGVLTTLALAGLYAGTRRSHLAPAHVRRTLSVILVCGALAAAYAVLQLAGLDPLAWANAPTYRAGGAAVARVFSTLGNPILLGNLLAAALALAIARLACGRGDPRWLAPAIALIAFATAATLSRGAWLAAALGACAALAGGLAGGGARAARRAGLALASVAVPVAIWAVAQRAPLMSRLAEVTRAEDVSGGARLEIARGALALWRAHPWLGTGPDSFGLMFPSVQTAAFWKVEWLGIPVQAHSAALQVLATLGTAGALAGLAWLVALGWALRHAPPAAHAERVALGGAVLALAVAGVVNSVGLAGAACFSVFSALAAGGAQEPGATPRPAGARKDSAARPERASRFAAHAAGIATAVVIAIAGAREMGALAAAGRARSGLDQATRTPRGERLGYAEPAVRHADRAAALAGGEDELWRLACDASLELAESAIALRNPAAARIAARRAAEAADHGLRLSPRRASNHERVANALLMRARLSTPDAALADTVDKAFGEALRLAPVDGLILAGRTRSQLLLGRPDLALVTARSIVALYPAAATGHALEAGALLALGRADEARHVLIRARDARWEEGAESQRRAVEDLLRTFARADSAR